MAALIYGLCAATSLLCAWLLFSAWRRTQYRLLLWSAICFAGLTLSNGVLIVDKLLTPPEVDLTLWRYGLTLISLLVFLYGLIWDTE
jgi:hypothetical protein